MRCVRLGTGCTYTCTCYFRAEKKLSCHACMRATTCAPASRPPVHYNSSDECALLLLLLLLPFPSVIVFVLFRFPSIFFFLTHSVVNGRHYNVLYYCGIARNRPFSGRSEILVYHASLGRATSRLSPCTPRFPTRPTLIRLNTTDSDV